MESTRELLRKVRQRPGMYGVGNNLREIHAFIHGLDAGTSYRLLDGFREFLILKTGGGENLGWPSLVNLLVIGASEHRSRSPESPDEEQMVLDATFELLDEFLAEMRSPHRRERLHHEFVLWQQSQSHYNPNLIRFSRSPAPDVLTVDEAAALLGVKRSAVFDLLAEGRLSDGRLGAEVFITTKSVHHLRDAE